MALKLRVVLLIAGALIWLLFALSDGGERAPQAPAVVPEQASRAEPAGEKPPNAPVSPEAPHRAVAPPKHPSPAAEPMEPGEGLSLSGLARRKAFLAEARDAEHAALAERQLGEQVRALSITQGSFDAVECRSAHCALRFFFAHEAALTDNQDLFDDLRRAFGMDLAAERSALPDQRYRVTVYVPAPR